MFIYVWAVKKFDFYVRIQFKQYLQFVYQSTNQKWLGIDFWLHKVHTEARLEAEFMEIVYEYLINRYWDHSIVCNLCN